MKAFLGDHLFFSAMELSVSYKRWLEEVWSEELYVWRMASMDKVKESRWGAHLSVKHIILFSAMWSHRFLLLCSLSLGLEPSLFSALQRMTLLSPVWGMGGGILEGYMFICTEQGQSLQSPGRTLHLIFSHCTRSLQTLSLLRILGDKLTSCFL